MEDTPRRPWFRFSLRTLFLVVTVVAMGCWLLNRSIGFEKQSQLYLRIATHLATEDEVLRAHFESLHEKYERAARYPWLPVEPDPPEPTPGE